MLSYDAIMYKQQAGHIAKCPLAVVPFIQGVPASKALWICIISSPRDPRIHLKRLVGCKTDDDLSSETTVALNDALMLEMLGMGIVNSGLVGLLVLAVVVFPKDLDVLVVVTALVEIAFGVEDEAENFVAEDFNEE